MNGEAADTKGGTMRRTGTSYITSAQVADRLGVTPATVATWCRLGLIPRVRAGGQWRIDKEQFEEALAAGKVGVR